MIRYLVISHLKVQGANMYNAAFLLGGPPVLPAWFMAHALGRKMDMSDEVVSVSFILHDFTPLGDFFYGKFNPQLRRGASYTFGSSKNCSDYSSKNPHALSLQPVACADMEVSLIVAVRDLGTSRGIDALVKTCRLAGGSVTGLREVCVCDDMYKALRHIRTGYAVMDRRNFLEGIDSSNRAHKFVEILGHKSFEGDGMGWISATCLGYAAISPFERREGAREGYEHAFAEPLIGLVQYVPLRRCLAENIIDQTLWYPEWVTSDTFRIYQNY